MGWSTRLPCRQWPVTGPWLMTAETSARLQSVFLKSKNPELIGMYFECEFHAGSRERISDVCEFFDDAFQTVSMRVFKFVTIMSQSASNTSVFSGTLLKIFSSSTYF